MALSDRDHMANMDGRRAAQLRAAATGARDFRASSGAPADAAAYLRWWIDNDLEPTGSGPNGLADYANYARTELAAFDAAVTDWELLRGFERL